MKNNEENSNGDSMKNNERIWVHCRKNRYGSSLTQEEKDDLERQLKERDMKIVSIQSENYIG